MTRDDEERMVQRLRLAFEMFETGLSMMRQKIRRSDPTASDEVVEKRLVAWLRTRPGAEAGDAPGTPRSLPR
jgi:hypothetical protein